MYKDNMVVALKCNSNVLREEKNIVYIPFGEEYSIHFKNLESKRAKVKISIDGQDVLNGNSIVIDGNNEFNLERFVDSLTEGSISNQEFKTASFGLEEDEKHVITFMLKGYTESGEEVNQPLTTKTPKICKVCGTSNKNINKYCHKCGIHLK